MRIEQEEIVAELVQEILDLTYYLINIAQAFDEAAGFMLGLAEYAMASG